MNLNCSHPRIQTFWSYLEGPGGGTPEVLVCMGPRLKMPMHKLGSKSRPHTQLDNRRGRRCWAQCSHLADPATEFHADILFTKSFLESPRQLSSGQVRLFHDVLENEDSTSPFW